MNYFAGWPYTSSFHQPLWGFQPPPPHPGQHSAGPAFCFCFDRAGRCAVVLRCGFHLCFPNYNHVECPHIFGEVVKCFACFTVDFPLRY